MSKSNNKSNPKLEEFFTKSDDGYTCKFCGDNVFKRSDAALRHLTCPKHISKMKELGKAVPGKYLLDVKNSTDQQRDMFDGFYKILCKHVMKAEISYIGDLEQIKQTCIREFEQKYFYLIPKYFAKKMICFVVTFKESKAKSKSFNFIEFKNSILSANPQEMEFANMYKIFQSLSSGDKIEQSEEYLRKFDQAPEYIKLIKDEIEILQRPDKVLQFEKGFARYTREEKYQEHDYLKHEINDLLATYPNNTILLNAKSELNQIYLEYLGAVPIKSEYQKFEEYYKCLSETAKFDEYSNIMKWIMNLRRYESPRTVDFQFLQSVEVELNIVYDITRKKISEVKEIEYRKFLEIQAAAELKAIEASKIEELKMLEAPKKKAKQTKTESEPIVKKEESKESNLTEID